MLFIGISFCPPLRQHILVFPCQNHDEHSKSKKSISLLKCWILNANWISLELYTVISTSLKNLLELFPICYFTQFNLSIYFSFGEWEISWKWLRFFYGRVCFFAFEIGFEGINGWWKDAKEVVMNSKWENVLCKVFEKIKII